MDVIWWNCGGSLKGKIDSIKYHIARYKPSAIFVMEADFRSMDVRLLMIDGYDLLLPSLSGETEHRIAAYVQSMAAFKQLYLKSTTMIGIELGDVKFFGYYRTHKKITQSLQTDLETALDEITEHSEKVVVAGGDFNIDNNRIHDQEYHNRGLALTLLGWMADNNMTQMINGDTWRRVIRNKDGIYQQRTSALDHIYTNESAIGQFGIIDSFGSDHEMISCILHQKKDKNYHTRKKFMRDWRSFTEDKVASYCAENTLALPVDIDEGLKVMNEYLLSIMDNLAPWKAIRTRRLSDLENVKIAACIKRRDRLLKKHRKYPLDQEVLAKLKMADRETRIFIKREKKKAENDPSRVWRSKIVLASSKTSGKQTCGEQDCLKSKW